jgi:3-oxoadipate enol-lactonase
MPNNFVQLYYEEYGQGLPVVLIHGFPLDHSIWNPLVPLLKDHARLILPDLRGFGKSPASESTPVFTMRMLADDILNLLDQLKIEQAVLVGHSMGGYVSLNFAHSYPHRLLGLGLVSTQAAADTPERRQARMIMAEEIGRRGLKHPTEPMLGKLTTQADLVDPLRQLVLGQPPKSVIAAQKGMAERPDASEWLSAIQVPAAVIAGSQDAFIHTEVTREMVRLLGWSWLVEIAGTGHLPMMEAPKAVANALRQLFDTIEGNQK